MDPLGKFSLLPFLAVCCQFVGSLSLTKVSRTPKPKRVELSKGSGALCLDGSRYAFQITRGSAKQWTLRFPGGGDACSSAEECEQKSTTYLGSSKIKDERDTGCACKNFDKKGAPLDCTCVDFLYCDGSYFSGHRAEGYKTVTGKTLWSRGRLNLRSSIKELLKNHGLADANEVVVTGESSGGLATIFTLDTVASMVPSSVKVLGLPIAGLTLNHGQCCAKDKCCYSHGCCIRDALSSTYDFHNMSAGISSECKETFELEPWRCLLGVHATMFVKTPMFLLQSKYDAWQLSAIRGLDRPGIYREQAGIKKLAGPVAAYGREFMKEFGKSFKHSNHSAYITSCICHAACGTGGSFFHNVVQGEWIGVWIGAWSAGLLDKGSLFVDDSEEPNYKCNDDGIVHSVNMGDVVPVPPTQHGVVR